jgi:hypothetical protein
MTDCFVGSKSGRVGEDDDANIEVVGRNDDPCVDVVVMCEHPRVVGATALLVGLVDGTDIESVSLLELDKVCLSKIVNALPRVGEEHQVWPGPLVRARPSCDIMTRGIQPLKGSTR